MSCYGCKSTFGIFRKEYGCMQCGFSFCGKCCNNKIILPKLDTSKKQLVCKSCFEELSRGISKQESISPPLAFKRRTENLKDTASNSGNEQDQVIAKKLQKLKHQPSLDSATTQTELEERLAKLKGIDPKIYTAPPIMVYREKDTRSATEKADDLIKQYQHEIELDTRRSSTDEEIAARLAKLRGENSEKVSEKINLPHLSPTKEEDIDPEVFQKYLENKTEETELLAKKEINDLEKDNELQNELKKLPKKKIERDKDNQIESSDDDDEIADDLIKRFAEEAVLDDQTRDERKAKKAAKLQSPPSDESDEDDELPWCVICMAKAQIRCFGCDRDLYCLRCFKEGHDSFDMTDHATAPYKNSKHTKSKG